MLYFVYSYYVYDVLVYVGKATGNPYTRYWNHVKKEHTWQAGSFTRVNKVGIRRFNTQAEMEICELYLIVSQKPLWNTQDVNPLIAPQLVVTNIPNEQMYSIQEFVDFYNEGKTSNIMLFEDPLDKYEIESYKKNQMVCVKPKAYADRVEIFYSQKNVVYLSCTAGRFKHKDFIEHNRMLIQNGADFSSVDRIESMLFSTSAEAKIYYKYCLGALKPLWLRSLPFWGDTLNISVSNVPSPTQLDNNELISICNNYDSNIRGIIK